MLASISSFLDKITGVEGSFGYVVIFVVVLVGYSFMTARPDYLSGSGEKQNEEEEEEEKKALDPPRNFTAKQLKYFDGTKDPKTNDDKPVYLSLNGTVFDVSAGRDFYGPEGPYEKFAGRECGVALAKMSFDEAHLDDVKGCAKLNFGEKTQLDEWHEKFQYYRNYPIKGRLIPEEDLPSPERLLTKNDLAKYKGDSSSSCSSGNIPKGYATAPIYVGAGDKVFDMSFGGVLSYGPDGPYRSFAGQDASRALATMSLNQADIENSDTSDLTEMQLKTLADWIKTFEEKKLYPVVGKLQK